MYTAMVKDPFRKWDRVYTVCALLVDLGTDCLTFDGPAPVASEEIVTKNVGTSELYY